MTLTFFFLYFSETTFAQNTFLKPHNFTYSGWRAGFRTGVYNPIDSGFKHLIYVDGFGISNHNYLVSYNKNGEKTQEFVSPVMYDDFRVYKQLLGGEDFFSGKGRNLWEPYACISNSKINRANNIFFDSSKYSNDVISLNDTSFFTFQEDSTNHYLNFYLNPESLVWRMPKNNFTGLPDSSYSFLYPKFLGKFKNDFIYFYFNAQKPNQGNTTVKSEFVKIDAEGNILKRVKNDHVFTKILQPNLGQKFFFFESYDSLNYPDRIGFFTDTNFNYIGSFEYPYQASSWKVDEIMPESDTTFYISFIVNDSLKTHNTTITEIVKFRFHESTQTFEPKRNFQLYFNQLGLSNCKTCFTYPTKFFRCEYDGGFYFLLESYFSKEIGWVGKCDSLGNIDFIDPNSTLQMNPPLFVGEKQSKYSKLEIFPNPTSGVSFIKGLPNAGTITILNAQGKLVSKFYSTGNHFNLDTEFLPIGVYFIQFQSNDGCCTRFGKLVVKE